MFITFCCWNQTYYYHPFSCVFKKKLWSWLRTHPHMCSTFESLSFERSYATFSFSWTVIVILINIHIIAHWSLRHPCYRPTFCPYALSSLQHLLPLAFQPHTHVWSSGAPGAVVAISGGWGLAHIYTACILYTPIMGPRTRLYSPLMGPHHTF